MNKASDIERMLMHIGSPDMLYREFDTSRSEARARADWRLLDAASGGASGNVTGPESAPGFDQSKVSAGEAVARRPGPYVERNLDMPPEPPSALPDETSSPAAGNGQLQQVFQRLQSGAAGPLEGSSAKTSKGGTPLSQLFRRLS